MSKSITEAMIDAAWQAFGDCPIDMCGDHDEEQKKCVVAAVEAALAAAQAQPVNGGFVVSFEAGKPYPVLGAAATLIVGINGSVTYLDGKPVSVVTETFPHMRGLTSLEAELLAALKSLSPIHNEIYNKWDQDMRAGKLLIALMEPTRKYRPDVTAIHTAIAKAEAKL